MSLQSRGWETDDEIAALGPWFHNLHLPGGVTTAPDHPLGDFPSYKWQQVAPSLPEDLSGCRALDIGCNAGYYTFSLAGRGASVIGIDHDPHYLRQAAWAADRLGVAEHVEFRQLDVYDVLELGEEFDLVLFMGVLYHLRHPLLGLDLVAQCTRPGGTVVLQTLTTEDEHEEEQRIEAPVDVPFKQRKRLVTGGWPSMAFVEHQFAGDPTNWWVPNAGAVEAMARSAGLQIVDHPAHEVWICQRSQQRLHGRTPDGPPGAYDEEPENPP